MFVIALLLPGCTGANKDSKTSGSNENITCGSETFSSAIMGAGSINGQDGWALDPGVGFDEAIVDLGSSACRGKGVWKVNNSVVSGAFANQPASPVLSKDAGESTIRSVGGGDTFETSIFFRTVGAVADGSSVTLSASPTSPGRNTYVRFDNDLDVNGGFRILVSTGNGVETWVGPMNRGQWYKLRIVFRAVDGIVDLGGGNYNPNDSVQIYLDGSLAGTSSSWEDYYAANGPAVMPSNRVMFRINNAASIMDASFSTPLGFYFDDFRQLVYNSNAPTTILDSYETGFEVP